MPATLYIVATPIGHLGDMSFRAVETLKQVDYIAAEDTRHSAFLMQHYGIATPMIAYHEHSDQRQTEKLLALLAEGKTVALVSDAGTPLISDPGFPLVRQAHAAAIPVIPIPGACAMVAALCTSGLPTDRFVFNGFLPARPKARQDMLQDLSQRQETQVFYEAPHRIVECLEDMCRILGDAREVTLARELTKSFETIHRATLAVMLEWVKADPNQQRGEIVLVVAGAATLATGEIGLDEGARQLAGLLLEELPPKTVSKIVAEFSGFPKKQVYDYIIGLKN